MIQDTGITLEVFSFLGNEYDFYFDFADVSKQVCTEMIYRGLNDKGGIVLPLTKRAGHLTLSADDIVQYYLELDVPRFDFILLAEEDPNSQDHSARVLTGQVGRRRLEELMADTLDQGSQKNSV